MNDQRFHRSFEKNTNEMFNIDNLFARNMEFAGSISHDLEMTHGVRVTETLKKISDNLMIDVHALSVCMRVCAAFHEDEGKVLLANVPQRAKSIGDFTILITSMGTGKSLIFSKIMEVQQLKKEYDLKLEGTHGGPNGTKSSSDGAYRHAILNEITGPGLTRYLDTAGNVFVLIDEFDGDHQKLGMFCSEMKSNNINSSASSVLKSLHSGIPFYQKGKVSDNGQLRNPQVSFLAGSNGAPVMDILRSKIKSSVMPDALVMRTVFEVIDSPPKFNSMHKNKFLPKDAIGLEILLLASSLVSNQTYIFDTEGDQCADNLLQMWQDSCIAAGSRWKNTDKWISARFAKTSELTARLAAQLAHIDMAYGLLLEFINENNLQNPNGPVSFHTYSQMVRFFHDRCSPNSNNPIVITSDQVEAAIYTTKIILLKFFNLFDLNANRSSPMNEIPWVPPVSSAVSNAAIVQLPTTQNDVHETTIHTSALNLFQMVLLYPSVCFTFTQLVNGNAKLKYRYDSVEGILAKLMEMKLLMKIENGIRSGRNTSSLYVKVLPETITMNTVNSFVVNILDEVKIPWTLYKSSCEKVVMCSRSATLSEEVRELFDKENYRKIIGKYETPENKIRKRKKKSSESSNQHSLNSIENISSRNGELGITSPALIQDRSDDSVEQEPDELENRNVCPSASDAMSISKDSSSFLSSNSDSPGSSMSTGASKAPVNYKLPRPPLRVMRNLNINHHVDGELDEIISKNTQKENSSVNIEKSDNVSEIASRVRRSKRERKINKRIYSPEPVEHGSNLTKKKKKSNERLDD